MAAKLSSAAEKLRTAHARALGALEAAEQASRTTQAAAAEAAHRGRLKAHAIARNRSAQRVSEHRLSARDLAAPLATRSGEPLDVADYVRIGHLALAGQPLGVNDTVEVPFLVPLVGRGNVLLSLTAGQSGAVVQHLVAAALLGTAPGQLDVTAYDPAMSGILAPFSPMKRVSEEAIQVFTRAQDFENAVHTLTGDVQRVKDTLRGLSPSLIDYRTAVKHPIESYRLCVLLDYPHGIDEATHRQIMALASAGPSAGTTFVIATQPPSGQQPDWWHPEELEGLCTVLREERGRLRWDAHPEFEVNLPLVVAVDLARRMDDLAARATSASAPLVPFETIERSASTEWSANSGPRLQFAIGLAGAEVCQIMLGDEQDQRHNILVTGAVGQGKSNLLKIIIHSLARRYSPSELEMYLLDFKEGVTLYPMAPTPGSPDFLPHARVLGLESDRDFGLAVLRHIEAEFARRAKVLREYGDDISRYRQKVPSATMPRIVVVVDEFHRLFEPNDKTAEEAARLLEAIARRGRSYGVHLILASQTISGVSALMTREGGIFGQFPIRIALKNSRDESYATLEQGNAAAARLRARGQAVLNLDYGRAESNKEIIIAAAGSDDELGRMRHRWWLNAKERVAPPIVFDGNQRLRVTDAVPAMRSLRRNAAAGRSAPAALLGFPIDVSNIPMTLPLTPEAGRHLAILGPGAPGGASAEEEPEDNAIGTLQTAALSLALQHPAGNANFVSFDMLDDALLERNNHLVWLHEMERLGHPVKRVGRTEIADYLQLLADGLDGRSPEEPALYLIGLGLDRATMLDTPDTFAHRPSEDLQQILRGGPGKRVHMLASWANAAVFRSHIGYGGEGYIDAMLMLRLDQSTVQDLLNPFITWSVRSNRGLLADRTQLAEPISIVPFAPITARNAKILASTDWDAS